MECNKEEAIRAMDIAKRRVTESDYNGAKTFANKAQNLYPQLDGLKQVLMLIDVYISAGNKTTGGESDWYGILGVDPLATDEVVKKQYRRLALLLHPDKNKCEGAEGAFKLVLEAWSLLSDKVKRVAYDQKRASKEVKPRKSRKQKEPPNAQKEAPKPQKQPRKQPKHPPNQQKQPPNPQEEPPNPQKQPPNQQKQRPNPQEEPPENQQKQPPTPQRQPPNQQKQPSTPQKHPKNQQKQPPNQPSSNGSRNGRAKSNKPTTKVSTFLTACNKCGTQEECVRVFFLNKTVRCGNCRVSFQATEIDKTQQATNKNTHSASSGKDFLSRMASFNSKSVANQPEEKAKRVVEASEEKDEVAGRGTGNADFKVVEERVHKKLRIDECPEVSRRIKV